VVAVLIVAGTVVVLAVLAAVTYLTARGFDAQPVVQLTGTLVAAAASAGTFLLNLAGRRTQTKVERNTGVLGRGVVQLVDQLEEQRGRHAPTSRTAPADPGELGDLDQDAAERSTPGPGRGPSYDSEGYRDTPAQGLEDTAWFRQ